MLSFKFESGKDNKTCDKWVLYSVQACLLHLHYISSFSQGEGLSSVSQDSVFRGMLVFSWQNARSLYLSLEIPQTGVFPVSFLNTDFKEM